MKISFNFKTILAVTAILTSFMTTQFVTADSRNEQNQIIANNLPIGSVILWGNQNIPDNWIPLNGQSTAMHPKLTDIFGNTLPDMRGNFARGFGGNSYALGLLQEESIKSHNHTATFTGNQLPGHAHGYSAYTGGTKDGGTGGTGADNRKSNYNTGGTSGGTPSGTVTLSATGSNETKPKNVAMIYIVKTK